MGTRPALLRPNALFHVTRLLRRFSHLLRPKVFSWEQELTAAFPEGAKPYEKDMHGGFAEDPDTGMIYTGIPGFGLCRISADLSKWERIGSDERLETGNVHGLCVFKHSGYSHIAVADNIEQAGLELGSSRRVAPLSRHLERA
jgi:hypothetical protein